MAIRETLTYSDYHIIERPSSRTDPEAKLHVETGMKFPRCKTILPPLDHSQSQTCKCGLKMTKYGNALECVLP
jgi:hypothetical protein